MHRFGALGALIAIAVQCLLPATVAAQTDGPSISGFTCCNLRHEGDLISDSNRTSLPMIPAGTPIRTMSYAPPYVVVQIGERRMRLQPPETGETARNIWLRRTILPRSPSARILAWPARVREAVARGEVAVGMTREQLVTSLGYPPDAATPPAASRAWRYEFTRTEHFYVTWDPEERVAEVHAQPHVAASVLFDSAAPRKIADTKCDASLPALGTTWSYRFLDRLYGRPAMRVSTRAMQCLGSVMQELVQLEVPGRDAVVRNLNARGIRIHALAALGDSAVIEVSPYLPATDQSARLLAGAAGVPGYPLGTPGLPDWIARVVSADWVDVEVPAGRYRALRVQVNGTRAYEQFTWNLAQYFQLVVWYAPKVRRLVRVEHMTRRGGPNDRLLVDDVLELLSYEAPSQGRRQ